MLPQKATFVNHLCTFYRVILLLCFAMSNDIIHCYRVLYYERQCKNTIGSKKIFRLYAIICHVSAVICAVCVFRYHRQIIADIPYRSFSGEAICYYRYCFVGNCILASFRISFYGYGRYCSNHQHTAVSENSAPLCGCCF